VVNQLPDEKVTSAHMDSLCETLGLNSSAAKSRVLTPESLPFSRERFIFDDSDGTFKRSGIMMVGLLYC
jgi:hypothetical protein